MKAAKLAHREGPACWLWPIPALRSEAEVVEALARHDLAPHICSNAVAGAPAVWRFVEFHAGRCAVCGEAAGLLVVDHKHGPRTVRGFLCYGCNALEGRASDLSALAGYRRIHPASMLGYREPFRGNGASQRVLRAVHAPARAQRYRELRIADVTRSIRRLSQDPAVDTDRLLPKKLELLGALWGRVASSRIEPTWQLVRDLAGARVHVNALATWDNFPMRHEVHLASLADLIAQLQREYQDLLGKPDPVEYTPSLEWIPPWER